MDKWTCSECGARFKTFGPPKFCPECGAKGSPAGGSEGDSENIRKCGRCRGTGEYPPDGGMFQKRMCKACNGTGWVRV
jgi:DnaJ-class molecular chaperone